MTRADKAGLWGLALGGLYILAHAAAWGWRVWSGK